MEKPTYQYYVTRLLIIIEVAQKNVTNLLFVICTLKIMPPILKIEGYSCVVEPKSILYQKE